MQLVTAEQMQEMDRQTIKSFGIPGVVLMENAGRGAFDFLCRRFPGISRRKVAVLAGRGNNGGDGFVIARYLMEKGVRVTCFLLSSKDKVQGDAKINMDLAVKLFDRSRQSSLVEIPDPDTFQKHKSTILHHDLYVDAILGTGLNSDVRGFFKDAIDLINRSGHPIFSIDIPSGLNSDTGRPMGTAVKADATATFAFAKAGHVLHPGNIHTGDLEIIDIGIPGYIETDNPVQLSLIERTQVADLFQPRAFDSHKGSYGHLLILAGSPGRTGAAALCANAAMRSGSGLVTLGVAGSVNKIIEPMVLEAMTLPLPESKNRKGRLSENCLDDISAALKDKNALAMGPGMGTGKGTVKLVHKLIKISDVPVIADADALNCIAGNPEILREKKAPAILTPHPGEMARLCSMTTAEIQENRIKAASDFSKEYDCIIVLKGAQTVISFPDGRNSINPTGNPGMASGGMGDVLTGIIAGLAAQGFTPEHASIAGVFIHGLCADLLAGEIGDFGYLASDMIKMIPRAIHKNILKN